MSLYKQFKMDEAKQKDGVSVSFGPNDDGTVPTFRIAHMSATNQRYVKVLERESKPFKRMMDLQILPPDLDRKIMINTFCQAILLGWDNVQDIDGKPFPFNATNSVKLMTELPELFFALQREANDIAKFREVQLENEAKN
jgi:hypothetical protein